MVLDPLYYYQPVLLDTMIPLTTRNYYQLLDTNHWSIDPMINYYELLDTIINYQ